MGSTVELLGIDVAFLIQEGWSRDMEPLRGQELHGFSKSLIRPTCPPPSLNVSNNWGVCGEGRRVKPLRPWGLGCLSSFLVSAIILGLAVPLSAHRLQGAVPSCPPTPETALVGGWVLGEGTCVQPLMTQGGCAIT